MTTVNTIARENPIIAQLATWRAGILAASARRSVYRRTVRELGALNDRELADLGMSRSMIRQIATEAAQDATRA